MRNIIFWFVIVFLLLGGLWYWTTKQEGNINLPFSLTKKSSEPAKTTPIPTIPSSTISENTLRTLIKDYLPNLIKPTFSGQVFCDHYLYGYDDQTAYLWTHCEEYYLKNNQLKSGAGISLPLKLELTGQKEVLAISKHLIIEDGNSYEQILKDNFPQEFARQALLGYPQEKLANPPEKQAKEYYSQ